jgi:type IX secretion system PorP/SprF family membrane protein
MTKFFTSFALLLVLCGGTLRAQDIHFSQFYAEPWYLNPAKTGFFPGNFRLSGAYRNQWGHITSPFRTFSASGELGWEWKGASKDIFGIGMHAFSDRSGDGNYTINNVGFSTAYNFGLDRFHMHFLGIGGGVNYVTHGFDPTHLRFDDEWTGVGTQESYTTNKTSYVDFSGGIEYNCVFSDKFNINFGWAAHHINEPRVTYTADATSKVYARNSVNFGATYTIRNKYQFYPRLLFSKQGPHTEINTGTFMKVRLDKSRKEAYALYLGSWYRWNDAIIPVARFDINDLSIGLSYDVNVSNLYTVSNGHGGTELTLLYTGGLPNMSKRRVNCPKF